MNIQQRLGQFKVLYAFLLGLGLSNRTWREFWSGVQDTVARQQPLIYLLPSGLRVALTLHTGQPDELNIAVGGVSKFRGDCISSKVLSIFTRYDQTQPEEQIWAYILGYSYALHERPTRVHFKGQTRGTCTYYIRLKMDAGEDLEVIITPDSGEKVQFTFAFSEAGTSVLHHVVGGINTTHVRMLEEFLRP